MFLRSLVKRITRFSVSFLLVGITLFLSFPGKAYAIQYNDPQPNVTNPVAPNTTAVELEEDTYNTLGKFNKTYNGKTFNALCYFLNYQDLRFAPNIGANPNALFQHYKDFGFNEGRIADRVINPIARDSRSKFEYVVPSYQKTQTQKDGMTVVPDEIHSNGGMNRRQENEARSVAYQLAKKIYDQVNTNGGGTQMEMLAYATGIVRAYCDAGRELTNDEARASKEKLYRTSYGVFIAHEYTCAGSTRALGLIIDYLDQLWYADYKAGVKTSYPPFKWVHVNANKWDEQWCQVVCDNHEAYADPIQAWAGYGKHPNWGGKKVDIKTYYKYATENDIINTRPRYVDGDQNNQIVGPPVTNNTNNMGAPTQSDSYHDGYIKQQNGN